MDTKRSKRNPRKQTNDVKLKSKEMINQALLSTPPQSKSSPKHIYSHISDDIDDMYGSQESSPVLLSTQEGGRGCEVIWDWRSPNRNNFNVLNNTPKAKVRRSAKYKLKSISPLLHLPSKNQFRKPMNTNFIDNLQAQLADIQRRFNSNKSVSTELSQLKTENSDYKSQEGHYNIVTNDDKLKEKLSSPKHNSPDISEYLKDDSFTDLLIQCSQVAESAINKEVNLTEIIANRNDGNMIKNSRQRSESPDLFMNDNEIAEHVETPKVKASNKLINMRNMNEVRKTIGSPQIKGMALSTPKKDFIEREEYINDDSFDAILSTLSEEAFVMTDSSGHSQKNINNNKIIKATNSYDVKSLNKNSTEKNEAINVNRVIAKGQKSDIRSSFSRHSSMPVSPRLIGSKYQLGDPIGRHNSMPYSCDKNKKIGMNNKNGGSTESLGYQSCSPTIQCTPDEIEKKRQEALKRKEAARIRNEIECRRLEAIEKLQMKSKSNVHRNCR